MLKSTINIFIKTFKLKPFLIISRFVLTTLESITLLINLLVPKWVIRGVINNDIKYVVKVLLFFLIYSLVCTFINRITMLYLIRNNEQLNIKLIDIFLKDTVKIKYEAYFNQEFINTYNFNLNKTCDVHNNVIDSVLSLYSSTLNILLTSIVVINMNLIFYGILIISILSYIIIKNVLNKYEVIRSETAISNNRKLQFIYNIFVYPNYIRDIKFKRYRKYIFEKKDNQANTYVNDYIEKTKPIANLQTISSVILNLENFSVIGLFSYLVIIKSILIEDYFICIQAYDQIKRSFLNFVGIYTSLRLNHEYIRKMDILKTKYKTDEREMVNKIESIHLEEVEFEYKNGDKINIGSMDFYRNDKVLITGDNGSGKSTFIYLMLGLLIPKHGQIYFNKNTAINTVKFNPESKISIQFQDTNIYPFKVIENITLDNESHNLKGKLVDRIEDKLDKYLTGNFSEEGINLSGGQIQTIGILRALQNESDIIIFDEPFNNLDIKAKSELSNIINNIEGKIVFVVSHEKSDIKFNKCINL